MALSLSDWQAPAPPPSAAAVLLLDANGTYSNVVIGQYAGAVGTVTVTGAGSQLISQGIDNWHVCRSGGNGNPECLERRFGSNSRSVLSGRYGVGTVNVTGAAPIWWCPMRMAAIVRIRWPGGACELWRSGRWCNRYIECNGGRCFRCGQPRAGRQSTIAALAAISVRLALALSMVRARNQYYPDRPFQWLLWWTALADRRPGRRHTDGSQRRRSEFDRRRCHASCVSGLGMSDGIPPSALLPQSELIIQTGGVVTVDHQGYGAIQSMWATISLAMAPSRISGVGSKLVSRGSAGRDCHRQSRHRPSDRLAGGCRRRSIGPANVCRQ